MNGIGDWLTRLGLAQYTSAFEQNDIDLALLPEINDQVLKDIGVASAGHRLKILAAIKALSPGGTPPSTPEPRGPVAPASPSSTQGERRQLTVMFCDLVGSTALSEQLDPEELRALLHEYRTTCGEVIKRYDGFVARYVGDGILTYFGWPVAHEDDAERSVRAALDIVAAIKQVPGKEQLAVRLGLATGAVVVGEQAGEGDQSKLAIGSTPNLAARLQGLASADQVVIASSTRRLVGNAFELADLGDQELKGISEPVHAWRVLALRQAEGRFEASHGEQLTPLVGREQEMGLLLDRWQLACEGEGQFVLLLGEPGIGKSRLLVALRNSIAKVPHQRLELRCSSFYQHSPLYPLIDALPRVLDWHPEDQPGDKLDKIEALCRRYALGEHGPGLLAALLSLPQREGFALPPMSPERQKQLTLEGLLTLALANAIEQPLLLVFEDLHWLDPTTLEWLSALLDQVAAAKILVVLSARPSFQVAWPSRSHLSALTLGRVSRAQSASIIAHLAAKPLPDEVLEQIISKTDGVPLFVEELTKTVIESDFLRESPTRFELKAPLPPLAIPSTLQDSLMARLDKLGNAKEIAQYGAALGRAFPYALLRAVVDTPDNALHSAASRLVDAEILHQKGLPPRATYVFKHALIQDAAYQSLLKSTRQQYHQRIAKVMVEQFPEEASNRPEFVAHQFTDAGMALEALVWWQKAGERAYARSAAHEAVQHYEYALKIAAAAPPSAELDRATLNVWIALGNARIHTEGWSAPKVEEAFRQAGVLSEHAGDALARFRVTYANWASCFVAGDMRRALPFAQRSLEHAQELNNEDLLINAHVAMGQTLGACGQLAQGKEHLEKVIVLYGPEVRRDLLMRFGRDPKVSAVQALVQILCCTGHLREAADTAEDILAFAKTIGHPFMIAWGYYAVCFVQLFDQSSYADSRAADEGIALADEQKFPMWRGWLKVLRGAKWIVAGNVGSGITDAEEGFETLRGIGTKLHEALFSAYLADGYRKQADIAAARKVTEQALDLMQQLGQLHAHAPLIRTQGEIWLASSPPDVERATACFLQAIEIARSQQAKFYELQACVSLARLWHSQGKRKPARELLQPVYDWFTEGFDTKDLKEATALLHDLTT